MTELALIFAIGALGLAFAGYLARWVLGRSSGEGELLRASGLVRAAAERFQRRQTSTIGALSAALGGAIFLAYGLLRRGSDVDPVPALELGVWLTVSFAVGAGLALASAHVATWATTRTSSRVAAAARRTIDLALQVGLRGGAVSGLFLVSTSVLGMAGLATAVLAYKGAFGADPSAALRLAPSLPILIAGYALGACFAAFLAQLGGGVFAKIADLGADLGGKPIGLDEDDPRNPATIVDLAGDAAGVSAARSAGLFASTVAESLAAMILGGALYRANESLKSALALLFFPLVTRAFGVVAAMFGVMVVRTDDREELSSALVRGLYVTATLHLVGVAGAAKWLLANVWLPFFGCAAIGIALAVALTHVVLYFTESRHRPVRELAEAARIDPSFAIASGLTSGVESAMAPFALVVVAAIASYLLGASSGLHEGGLFGVASATIGFLGVAAYVLAMDSLGAIADVAAGLVEASVGRDRPDVRGRAALLDAVGNSVKAIAKAYAACGASLASVLLVAAFLGEAQRRAVGVKATSGLSLPLDRPEIYFGALVGVALVAWVATRLVGVIVRGTRRIIDEVRRQAKDRPPGFVPDHEGCLEMITRSALGAMLLPAAVTVASPLAVGVLLRSVSSSDNPLSAANAVAALILAATIAGVLGSLLLGNAGGAWDNAKKYIATGAHGGRHLVDETGARADNPTYLAALVGDSVGDLLKDAASPAIHVLVKMLPVLVLVFLPFFL